MQRLEEVVSDIGPVLPGVQLPGQSEEWLRVVVEEREIEDGLGVRDVILPQVAVQAAPWRSAERS